MGGTNNLLGQGSVHISGSREAGDGTVTYHMRGMRLGGGSTDKDYTDFLHSQSRNISEPPPCHAVYAPSASKAPKGPLDDSLKKAP